MANVLYMPTALKEAKHVFGVYSDFCEDQLDALWVDTITDTGTVAMGDAVGGQAVLTPSDCSVADNDEAYLACPNEIFLCAAGKPLYGECRMKFSEVVAGDLNFGFFFMNAIAANAIIDTAGGLKVSGSTLGIYKAETTAIKCVSSINGTSTVSTSTFTPTAGTFYTYGIEVLDYSSTQALVAFTVDGVRLKDSTTGLDIVHTISYASATEMQVGVGIKLGAATNNNTLTVDYLGAFQQR